MRINTFTIVNLDFFSIVLGTSGAGFITVLQRAGPHQICHVFDLSLGPVTGFMEGNPAMWVTWKQVVV